jgi:hypothetical protein
MFSQRFMRSMLLYLPSLFPALRLADLPRLRREVDSLLAREVSLMPMWMRLIQWSLGLREEYVRLP